MFKSNQLRLPRLTLQVHVRQDGTESFAGDCPEEGALIRTEFFPTSSQRLQFRQFLGVEHPTGRGPFQR